MRSSAKETLAPKRAAPLFAALGDETRLRLVTKLGGGEPLSIAALTDGTSITRQGVTKHLRILEDAGLVRSVKKGRESHFELAPGKIDEAKRWLDVLSRQWDDALERLRAMVEE